MLLSEAHRPLTHPINVPEPSLGQALRRDPGTETLPSPRGLPAVSQSRQENSQVPGERVL